MRSLVTRPDDPAYALPVPKMPMRPFSRASVALSMSVAVTVPSNMVRELTENGMKVLLSASSPRYQFAPEPLLFFACGLPM